jgi:PAS domain S-box-containing protein
MEAELSDGATFDVGDVLDYVPHGVVVLACHAVECDAVHANEVFTHLTGFDREALAAVPLWQLLAGPDSDRRVQQQFRSHCATGRGDSFEWLVYRQDGSPFWARLTVRPMRARGGRRHCVVSIEDISAHRQARDSLRVSDGRLEVAMSANNLSMWDWNIPRNEVSYNPQWRESLGIDPHSLLNRTELHERLLLPNDPAILEQFEDHYHGRSPAFRSEYALTTAQGVEKWFEAYAKVLRRDDAGKPLRMIGVLHDISDRRRAEKEARDVHARWERAVHGTSDGLYEWDLLTGHVWYAERFRAIVGYEADEFPDTFNSFKQALHPEDCSLVLGKVRAHLENHAPLDLRCRIVSRDGRTIRCRLRGEAVRDAAGRPTRLSGSISDISAQVDAEEALLRSQDFYGTMLDALPLFIGYADRDERVVYANRAAERLLGVPLATSRGCHISEALGPRRYEAIGPYVLDALHGKPTEGQGRLRDGAGNLVDLDAIFLPHYDEFGELQGCIVAARDVTERCLLEAELRQSQKMEAIGRLTGGIAHDFNNLLSVIIGNMQLLARSVTENPRLLRQAETALSAAMRGAALTRRLLGFARQQVLEPRVVDMNSLIGGMYELLCRTLTGECEIRQSLAPDLWRIRADPSQLENSVLNLVINARDAMPNGGIITLCTRNVAIGAMRQPGEEALVPGHYAVLEVADCGSGMSEQVLKRALEPFFTTKDIGKGTGLGLPMVYGFVKQSGGHVSIASAPNEGTTVRMYFPREFAGELDAASEGLADAELPGGDECVLVVDDNAEVRRTAVEILTSLGYRVLEAGNGQQALERFVAHADIDLVFSDVMLPGGMLGSQLMQKLREVRPEIKILMTSGFSESGIMHRGVLDGTIDLLPKPYKVEELARRVRSLLDSKQEMHGVSA